ncbi:hypothetical protein DDK01_18040 [Mycobacteroides abscessus]|uniref:hypothetical protein n=1 Tax=Mycobacteroides abscessus TaxID=36809 RepID=UPI000D3E1481|nr:hypothetical protein [Mycobacteroides abscessus]PVA91858.1 hypothetical protein DDK01_18040 [Mycobacteroides abscessus]
MVRKFFSKPTPFAVQLGVSYNSGEDRVDQVVSVGVTAMRSVRIGVYNAADAGGSLVMSRPDGGLRIEYATFSIEEIVAGTKKTVRFDIQHFDTKCFSSTHAVDTTYQYEFDGFAPSISGKYTPSSFQCLMRNRA